VSLADDIFYKGYNPTDKGMMVGDIMIGPTKISYEDFLKSNFEFKWDDKTNKLLLDTGKNIYKKETFSIIDISYYDSDNIQYKNLLNSFKKSDITMFDTCFNKLKTTNILLPECNHIIVKPNLLFILQTLEWKINEICKIIKDPYKFITTTDDSKKKGIKFKVEDQIKYIKDKNIKTLEFILGLESIVYNCNSKYINIKEYIIKLIEFYDKN